MVSALCKVDSHVPDLKAERSFLKVVKHEFMQKACSFRHRKLYRELDLHSATVFSSKLGTCIKIDQNLFFWLVREAGQLCPDLDSLNQIWNSLSEQYHQNAIQTQHRGSVVHWSFPALLSCSSHCSHSLSSDTILLGATMNADLSSKHRIPSLWHKLQKKTFSSFFQTVSFFSESFHSQPSTVWAHESTLLAILSSSPFTAATPSPATTLSF